jgi:hypothetical protein
MKKIAQLVIGLLIINSSSIMGMDAKLFIKYFENIHATRTLQRKAESDRWLSKKEKKRQIRKDRAIQWQMQEDRDETTALALGKVMACILPMGVISTVLQSSEIASRNKAVCFDEMMINALWAVYALTIARSCYEFYTEKPLFESRSKNMLLASGQFAASAVPMICSSVVDGYYNAAPHCIELRQAHSVASLLVAGYCLYQASLNK